MKMPVYLFIFPSLFLILSVTSCSKDSSDTNPEEQTFHDYLVKTVTDENIPGIMAAISDSNGVFFIESAGVRKTGSSEQITNNDQFHLGSCTKAMTSVLLATLVADGELQWETTILDVFPELEGMIHTDFNTVTLHQLVTHRAGLEANATNWNAYQEQEITERRYSIMKDNLQDASAIAQGEFNYSNLGYMIAGCMAERITGKSWETLISERLFEPLEMNSAGFGPPGTIGQVDQPWGHVKFNNKWQPLQDDNPEALGPAGRVHCSFEDWGKFLALFLGSGNTTILERDQLDTLVQPVGEYACGWGVAQRDWSNGNALNHAGSNTIWYVIVWVAPEINRAYFAGTNSCDENSGYVLEKVITNLIRKDKMAQ